MIDVIEDRLIKKTIKLSEEGPEGTQILVLDTALSLAPSLEIFQI
jgi:hypothetical protein